MSKKTNDSSHNTLSIFYFWIIFVFVCCIFKTTNVFADETLEYTLMSNLPNISSTPTHGEYLVGIIKLIIGITTMLSVLVIIYAGVIVQVGGAASPSARSAANDQIKNALLGLVLAITSYIILKEINPALLSLDLTLP